ncbi:hypothetical protein A9Z42_0085090 [Trichoderma parareesei]|uniref:60S ribosomal subunit assembly/export protein LOC1 n=1 Tax=Trichoderma parareesei TaxID=858221 RepID=A0A2H3A913_TRIPA|nr:hypothetical protein A9Z42_0085090 [Trichoderma parareesei]
MAPSKTRTIKNKHAGSKSGAGAPGKGGASKRSSTDGVSKSKKPKGPVVSQQVKEKNRALLMKRPKKKTYTAEELGIPTLNMITPVGVEKPKGKKKGKVFVDDKEGHIESKIMKARQMEEIREARRLEAEKKSAEKKAKFEDTKESLRKKRKRKNDSEGGDNLKSISQTGSKAVKGSKKKVSFA